MMTGMTLAALAVFAATEVKVSEFGFKPGDSTAAIQKAFASGAKRIVFDAQPSAWVTAQPIFPKSGMEIVLEKGVVLEAKRGTFRGLYDCLFDLRDVDDVTIRGAGATPSGSRLTMHKEDYASYERSQHRHGIAIRGSHNITVEGLIVERSGGDGIYVCDSIDRTKADRLWSGNVVLRDIVSRENWRQGVSIISARHLLMERVIMRDTKGTLPEAGIDFEPNEPDDVLVDIVLRDCHTVNNNGAGYDFMLPHMEYCKEPISIRLENCSSYGDEEYGVRYMIGQWAIDHPRNDGTVVFENCTFERTGNSALQLSRRSNSCGAMEFHHCRMIDCCRREKFATANDLRVNIFGHADLPVARLVLDDVYIRQSTEREWMPAPFRKTVPGRATDISGRVTVESKKGIETIVMDEAWRNRNYPPSPRAALLPSVKFSPKDVTVVDRKPGESVRLSPYNIRGAGSYVFYADRARTVRFSAKIDRVGSSALPTKPLEVTGVGGRKVAALTPPGIEEQELSFDAPEAGFYRLKVASGGHAMRLCSSDAPVAVNASAPVSSIWMTSRAWIPVTKGRQFAFTFQGEDGERAGLKVSDPSGKVVWNEPTVDFDRYVSPADGEPGLWTIDVVPPQSGRFEDFMVYLTGVPGFLFLSDEKYWEGGVK